MSSRRPSRFTRSRLRAAVLLFLHGYEPATVKRLLGVPIPVLYDALRKLGALLVLLCLLPAPAAAQITIPNTFVNGTPADATLVNANFAALGSNALNRTGGTMTGTLTSQVLTPATDATYAIGDATHRYTGLSLTGATNGGVMYGTGTAVAFSAAGTSGQVLQSNGAAAPSWVANTLLALYQTGDVYMTLAGSCLAGFTDVSATYAGFYPVVNNTNVGSTVGTALTALENRAVGQHTHTVASYGSQTGPGLGVAGWDVTTGSSMNPPGGTAGQFTSPGGLTLNNAGSVAGTNAPYKYFRMCQKP